MNYSTHSRGSIFIAKVPVTKLPVPYMGSVNHVYIHSFFVQFLSFLLSCKDSSALVLPYYGVFDD